jgi:hypothetical protein
MFFAHACIPLFGRLGRWLRRSLRRGLLGASFLSSLALPAMTIVLTSPVVAQDAPAAEDHVIVAVRVTSASPRFTAIDRGSADGLIKGDRVVFRPRGSAQREGVIVRVSERSAVVELGDATLLLAAGTRGEVRVPRSRSITHLEPAATAPPPEQREPTAQSQPSGQAQSSGQSQSPVPSAQSQPQAPPEHPPWPSRDDEWNEKQPLLAGVRPLRPSERDLRVSGSVFVGGDYLMNTEGPTHNVFARTGGSLLYENVFGGGGDLHVEGEVNYRMTDVPDDDDEQFTRGILYRLSYSVGGNRFAPDRFEVGRFLQHEMPEFGVLDGFEWDRRLAGGDSFGASVGFLPVPDEHFSTGTDFALAAWYRWVADESELFSVTGGFQKTFHNFDADRDLFVAKAMYLPGDGWMCSGALWVDLYGAGDTAKNSAVEITEAYVTTGRTWESGSALRATYAHIAFPELDRNEFTPVTQQELANAHTDRLSAYGRQAIGRSLALFGLAGVWKDQDEDGGDAEFGFDVDHFLFDGSRFETSGFGALGNFTTTVGWRASVSVITPHTNWRVGYEFTQDNINGFQNDNDDIPQHAARGSWEIHGDTGWTFSANLGLLFYDTETAVNVGVLLQRSF